MIGLDTNVLARYFVEESDADAAALAQREAARRLIESGETLFIPTTVLLELEWVLWGYCQFSREQVSLVFEVLLQLPAVQHENRAVLEQAHAGHRAGLGFADALHHAGCRDCHAMASFEHRSLARPPRQLNLQPRVIIPR